MTDTGQVPGEGQPENAGAQPEGHGHPGAPVPGTYTFPETVETVEPAEGDDELLMPGAHGAWGELQPQQGGHQATRQQPQQSQQGQQPQQFPEAQAQPQPQPQQVPQAQQVPQPAQAAEAQQPEQAQQSQQAPQPQQAQPYGGPMPQQGRHAHTPGAHETDGRDSGAIDYGAVRTPQQSAPGPDSSGHTPRRPLHLGPPVPEQSGTVRPLSDRGPAPAPAQTPQPGAPPAGGPEYLDGAPQDPGPLPGPQLGELPQQREEWNAAEQRFSPAETVAQTDTAESADAGVPADAGAGAMPAQQPAPGTAGPMPAPEAEQVPGGGEQSPAEGAQVSADAGLVATETEQGPAGLEQGAVGAEQGAAEAGQLPAEAGEAPAADAEQVSAEAGQVPADAEQSPQAEQSAQVTEADAAVQTAVQEAPVEEAPAQGAGTTAGEAAAEGTEAGAATGSPATEASADEVSAAVAAELSGAHAAPAEEPAAPSDSEAPAGTSADAEGGAHANAPADTDTDTDAGSEADAGAADAAPAAEGTEAEAPEQEPAAEAPEGDAAQREVPAEGVDPVPIVEDGSAGEAVPSPDGVGDGGTPAAEVTEAAQESAPASSEEAAGETPEERSADENTSSEEANSGHVNSEHADAGNTAPGSTESPSAEPENAATAGGEDVPAAPEDTRPADGESAAPEEKPSGEEHAEAAADSAGTTAEQPADEGGSTAADAAATPSDTTDEAAAHEPAAHEAAAPQQETAQSEAAPQEDTPQGESAQGEAAQEDVDRNEATQNEAPAAAATPGETPAGTAVPQQATAEAPAAETPGGETPEAVTAQDEAPAQPAEPSEQTGTLEAGENGQANESGQTGDSGTAETGTTPEPTESAEADAPAESAESAEPADSGEAPEPTAESADTDPEADATADPVDADADPDATAAPEPRPLPTTDPAPGFAEAEREAVHRLMRERRDIRNGFRPDPIPHEVLLRVLEAAHTAPSVGHSQPWDFVVIRSEETRRAMHELATRQREAYAKSLPKARAKQFKELKIEAILDTPVNIVVTADPTRGGRHTLGRHTQPQMAPYSSALAVENLWLAARAEGLGVGWVSFFDEREMVRSLELPEHLEVVAYLCVGYVDEFPPEPELMQAGWSKRRPLSWVVHEESYGRRVLPGADPHDLLADTVDAIRPLDAKALGEAWERQKRMTKPAGALGMLEIISAQLCGLSRQCPPPVPEPAAVAVFAGDHGVHGQGVTPWPQEVTGQMVANFLGGGAVCNAFANQVGAEVCVVDVGVAGELPATPGLLPRKVRAGTADMTTGPALTREEVKQAIEVGIETARDLVTAGNKALLTGEMGIANTTASAALISACTGTDPAEVTGRGTGINDETHSRKVEVVRRALDFHKPDPADAIGLLSAVGGLEHAALVGLILGGASLRTPVILDGVSAGAAALVARALAPEALAACIAGHRSAEPGHVAALTKLGLRPLVDLDLRLGEGTGALLALPMVQSAARAMHEVATFDSAGVTEKG